MNTISLKWLSSLGVVPFFFFVFFFVVRCFVPVRVDWCVLVGRSSETGGKETGGKEIRKRESRNDAHE